MNIAVELLGDAQDNVFDTAIVVSGDGDLAGPDTRGPTTLSPEAGCCRIPTGPAFRRSPQRGDGFLHHRP